MKPAEWDRVKELFWAALERAPAERSAYVREACGTDEPLRAEVESLLRSHERGESFIERLVPRGTSEGSPALFRAGRIGIYELIREIGQGGMATVYLARDPRHERQVAVKVLRPELAVSLGPDRFLREIRVTAHLQHPHILPLYDSGAAEGALFYVMPYVEGESLRSRLVRERQLPLDEALAITCEVADALSYAHSHDVVHRDIKPENILLASGHALVADFGIARAITEAGGDRLTHTGLTVGTPGYMSPEQAAGSQYLDGRSDQYSLACMLYELLAGEPPYTGPTPQAIMAKQLTDPLPHLGTVRAVPPGVEEALGKALAKMPADRFPTVTHFALALQRPAAPPRRRATRMMSGIGLAAILIGGLILGLKVNDVRLGFPGRAGPATDAANPPSGPIRGRRSVAVLGFKNVSERSDQAWLSAVLSEILTMDLEAGEQLRLIPGEEVAHMKSSLGVPDADSYGKETLGRIRKNLSTDDVVVGSYIALGDGQIRLSVRLQDTQAGETLVAVSGAGTEKEVGDLNALVDRVVAPLRQRLGAGELSATASAAVRATLPSDTGATRLYSEGLARLRAFDALGARPLFERVVAADPNNALARSALAAAWSALGYDHKAQDEAKKAVDLSRTLPAQDRLWVEGRYRETTNEWGKAAEIYGTLWGLFPDNIEYGLRRVNAQLRAGKGKDAVVTVAALRKLPPLERDDPRIDVAEAQAASALGDNLRALEAATSATRKGDAQGARLVVAFARNEEGRALHSLGEPRKARAAYEEAQRIYAAVGDRDHAARAMNNVATLLWDQGDFAHAIALYDTALAVFREIGNKYAVAAVLNNVGNALKRQGDLKRAMEFHREGLEVRREVGDKSGVAGSLLNIGTILYRQGKLAEARRSYEESAAISQEIGDRSQRSMALHNLAEVFLEQGEVRAAKKTYEQVLAMRRAMQDKSGLGYTLLDLSELLVEEGDLAAARRSAEEALGFQKDLGEKGNVAGTQLELASITIEEGRPADAEVPARQAVEEFENERAVGEEAGAWTVLARSFLEQRRSTQAREAIARAADLAERARDSTVRWPVGIVSAQVLALEGRAAEARGSLEAIVAASQKLGFVHYELEASLALAKTEMTSGDREVSRARLIALAEIASAKGFVLIARKARAAAGQSRAADDRRGNPGALFAIAPDTGSSMGRRPWPTTRTVRF